MIATASDKAQLLLSIEETIQQLLDEMSVLNEDQVNQVPYKDSWTPAQLFRHIAKSNRGIAKAMEMPSKPTDRDPGERIEQLKNTFLDFSTKLQAPEFIIPEPGPYQKQAIIEELEASFEKLKRNVNQIELTGLVEGLPLGPI